MPLRPHGALSRGQAPVSTKGDPGPGVHPATLAASKRRAGPPAFRTDRRPQLRLLGFRPGAAREPLPFRSCARTSPRRGRRLRSTVIGGRRRPVIVAAPTMPICGVRPVGRRTGPGPLWSGPRRGPRSSGPRGRRRPYRGTRGPRPSPSTPTGPWTGSPTPAGVVLWPLDHRPRRRHRPRHCGYTRPGGGDLVTSVTPRDGRAGGRRTARRLPATGSVPAVFVKSGDHEPRRTPSGGGHGLGRRRFVFPPSRPVRWRSKGPESPGFLRRFPDRRVFKDSSRQQIVQTVQTCCSSGPAPWPGTPS